MGSKKGKPTAESWKLRAARGILRAGRSSARLGGKASAKTLETSSKFVWRKRKEIAGSIHGAAEGTYKVARGAQAQVRFKHRLRKRQAKIRRQARTQALLAGQFERRTNSSKQNRNTILDSIAVGGETLYAHSRSHSVPDDLLSAYETAFPDLAQTRSFQEALEAIPTVNLVGFSSVLKGKLFEMKYVDWLNSGNLPSGYQASLAESPTNPEWDIKVTGPDGQISQVIQAKATDSVYYVEEALRQNPHIDVVTTSEVAAQIMAQGIADNVIDSGMSIEELNGNVFSAMDSGAISIEWAPPAVAIALIAFSSYRETDLGAYQKAKSFGARSSQAYLVYLLGGAVAVSTGTVWLGVLGAMGVRLFFGHGTSKADQLKELSDIIKANDRAQKRTWTILNPSAV